MRRYQLDCDRKFHRAIQALRRLRRDEALGIEEHPALGATPGEELLYPPGSECRRVCEADAEVLLQSSGDTPDDQAWIPDDLVPTVSHQHPTIPEPECTARAGAVPMAGASSAALAAPAPPLPRTEGQGDERDRPTMPINDLVPALPPAAGCAPSSFRSLGTSPDTPDRSAHEDQELGTANGPEPHADRRATDEEVRSSRAVPPRSGQSGYPARVNAVSTGDTEPSPATGGDKMPQNEPTLEGEGDTRQPAGSAATASDDPAKPPGWYNPADAIDASP